MVSSPDSTNSSHLERKAEESPPQPKPADGIPNGGLRAWLQVLGSFMVFLNTWYAFCPLYLELLDCSHRPVGES